MKLTVLWTNLAWACYIPGALDTSTRSGDELCQVVSQPPSTPLNCWDCVASALDRSFRKLWLEVLTR